MTYRIVVSDQICYIEKYSKVFKSLFLIFDTFNFFNSISFGVKKGHEGEASKTGMKNCLLAGARYLY